MTSLPILRDYDRVALGLHHRSPDGWDIWTRTKTKTFRVSRAAITLYPNVRVMRKGCAALASDMPSVTIGSRPDPAAGIYDTRSGSKGRTCTIRVQSAGDYQLSYPGIEPLPGDDPGTSILPRWRSTAELKGRRNWLARNPARWLDTACHRSSPMTYSP